MLQQALDEGGSAEIDGELGSTWGCFDDFRMRGVTAQMARKGDADQVLGCLYYTLGFSLDFLV
jgi:hypothetical protein